MEVTTFKAVFLKFLTGTPTESEQAASSILKQIFTIDEAFTAQVLTTIQNLTTRTGQNKSKLLTLGVGWSSDISCCHNVSRPIQRIVMNPSSESFGAIPFGKFWSRSVPSGSTLLILPKANTYFPMSPRGSKPWHLSITLLWDHCSQNGVICIPSVGVQTAVRGINNKLRLLPRVICLPSWKHSTRSLEETLHSSSGCPEMVETCLNQKFHSADWRLAQTWITLHIY